VGCITRGTSGPSRPPGGRAVTMPANLDENNATVLDTVFLSREGPS